MTGLTPLDWIIVGFTLAMALWGYAQGLIVGALSLVGFGVGAFLGSRLGPLLVEGGSESPYAPLFALFGALIVGGVLAAGAETVGFHLRGRLGATLGMLDGAAGAVLLSVVALGFAWVVGAVALQTPGARELRRDIQRSAILSALNDALPPSGPILNALARFDPFPEISGPDPGVGEPDSRIARDPEVRAAGDSIVRVLGTACGLGVQGSGWIAGDGLVVTNAHVVAGQDDTTVQVGGSGTKHGTTAVHFDARNDLAILRAPGIADRGGLRLDRDAEVGDRAAVLGFPGNGDYDVQPARLGGTETVLTNDAYGRGPIRRKIASLRALVRQGNSGGPAVDGEGEVVATIFAAARSGEPAGFGVPNDIVREALSDVGGEVDTGPCTR